MSIPVRRWPSFNEIRAGIIKLFDLFKKPPHQENANRLYLAIVNQSRHPDFYENYGVADTLEGRFDMIVIHAFLVLHRFKTDHDKTEKIAQVMFDLMFADFDRSLREMGIGDVGVSVRIKKMVEAFYGRIQAYEEGLDKTDGTLETALTRNLYHGQKPTVHQVAAMADYIRVQIPALADQPIDDLLEAKLEFSTPTGDLSLAGDTEHGG